MFLHLEWCKEWRRQEQKCLFMKDVTGYYDNLHMVYTLHDYSPTKICNFDERAQSSKGMVLMWCSQGKELAKFTT